MAALLMLPFTFILWQYLPQLRFVQLPWRWLLCLNVSFVLLVTMGMRGWRSRSVVCVVMLAGLLVVWTKIQLPWWDKAADIADLVGDMNEGYEGVDEYVPRDADPSLAKPGIPQVVVAEGGASEVRIENWAAQTRRFTVVAEKPGEAIVRLFNYPAWHVEVNDQQVIPETQPDTGLMVIPVDPGRNRVLVTFIRTRDRVVGAALSTATGLLMILLAVWKRRD